MKEFVLMMFFSIPGLDAKPVTIQGFSTSEKCYKAAEELAPIYVSQIKEVIDK